jgi:flagellar secretion chaperone FliS
MLTDTVPATDSPTAAVVRVSLLLEAAARQSREAQALLLANEDDASGRAIEGALRIVDALHGALDHARGGDLAKRLEYLYSYGALRLLQGASTRNPQPMEEAAGVFGTIAGAWRELAAAQPAIAA